MGVTEVYVVLVLVFVLFCCCYYYLPPVNRHAYDVCRFKPYRIHKWRKCHWAVGKTGQVRVVVSRSNY